jgi:hypothetical protein
MIFFREARGAILKALVLYALLKTLLVGSYLTPIWSRS